MTEGFPEDTEDNNRLQLDSVDSLPQALEYVKVRRSSGQIDDGWQVVKHFEAQGDAPAYVLVTKTENGETLTKKVHPHHLLEANRPAESNEMMVSSEGMVADSSGESFKTTQRDLEKSREQGVDLDEIFNQEWEVLEVETADGRIILKRISSDPKNKSVLVESSDDETLVEGSIIALEGSTMTGMWVNGAIGPGARLAYRLQQKIHYTLGEKTSNQDMTISQKDMDEWTSGSPEVYMRTEDGVDMTFFIPKPYVTNSFVGHALIVNNDENNEPVSKYLF